MKFHRIYAVILRYLFLFRRSLDRASEIFFWPAIDIFIWGITSTFFEAYLPAGQTGGINSANIVLVILAGIGFWLIVWRTLYLIPIYLLEDLWNKNLVNIFVTPLKFSEWVAAFIIIAAIKVALSFIFAVLLAWVLYSVKIYAFGFYFLPFVVLLVLSGWWMGFFIAGLILRFGTRVQAFAWTLGMVVAPFTAIYYPVSVLPAWAQKVAVMLPTTYVFEGAREVIRSGTVDVSAIYISLFLNLLYLVLSIIFLKTSFQKVLQRGLVKLY